MSNRFKEFDRVVIDSDRYAVQGIPRGVEAVILDVLGDGVYSGAVTIDELLRHGSTRDFSREVDLEKSGGLSGDIDFTVFDDDLKPL